MRYVLYTLLGVGLFIPSVNARPVSYPGGITFIAENNGEVNSVNIHYSPTAKISFGYKFEYWRDQEFRINALQMNNLIKRWNEKDSQANLYLKSGLGVAQSSQGDLDDKTETAIFAGFATDWENRRFFVSYENRYTEAGDIDDFYMQSVRVGVAPYEGDYGDLHTWLMLDIKHSPENKDNFTVTSMVRIFKGFHLLEAGMSNRGEVLFNYILRY